jgi:hypothetical protein
MSLELVLYEKKLGILGLWRVFVGKFEKSAVKLFIF